MKPHPTDGNLDALHRHLSEDDDTPPPDDWEDEERAEAMARRRYSDREEW